MKKSDAQTNKLVLNNETLRAKLDIRNFFLEASVKTIYENIGQLLSLVHLQLTNRDNKMIEASETISSGNLVLEAIKGLRSLSKSFYPEHIILNEPGFGSIIKYFFQALGLTDSSGVKVLGIPKETSPEVKLILSKIFLNILTFIKDTKAESNRINIIYTRYHVSFTITYKGESIDLDKNVDNKKEHSLSISQTSNLIGSINIKTLRSGMNRIVIKSQLKDVKDERNY